MCYQFFHNVQWPKKHLCGNILSIFSDCTESVKSSRHVLNFTRGRFVFKFMPTTRTIKNSVYHTSALTILPSSTTSKVIDKISVNIYILFHQYSRQNYSSIVTWASKTIRLRYNANQLESNILNVSVWFTRILMLPANNTLVHKFTLNILTATRWRLMYFRTELRVIHSAVC